MTLPVSVVVVSRGRPQALTRCLAGLAQLNYDAVEVVVVACPDGIAAVQSSPFAEQVKQVPFDKPNISEARNLGIGSAAGEIVAFIDDDAVPEPLWLTHLVAPFQTAEVAATGGYVIGRNGISYQWTARTVDGTGEAKPLPLEGMDPVLLSPPDGRAIKTEGTNMAVRRDLLAEMGGFDPAYAFFLDETDLNMRLALAGQTVALVPLAQVHHGYQASARRSSDRTPTDLRQIGASKMVFLRKYTDEKLQKRAWKRFRNEQRLRLLSFMQRGPLGADDVLRLLRGLNRGKAEGAARELQGLAPLPRASEGFRSFQARPGAKHVCLKGRIWQAKSLRKQAAELVASGSVATLFLLGPSPRKHWVRFTEDGYWEQNGGLWGQSERSGAKFQFWRISTRFLSECVRISPVRGHDSNEFHR